MDNFKEKFFMNQIKMKSALQILKIYYSISFDFVTLPLASYYHLQYIVTERY